MNKIQKIEIVIAAGTIAGTIAAGAIMGSSMGKTIGRTIESRAIASGAEYKLSTFDSSHNDQVKNAEYVRQSPEMERMQAESIQKSMEADGWTETFAKLDIYADNAGKELRENSTERYSDQTCGKGQPGYWVGGLSPDKTYHMYGGFRCCKKDVADCSHNYKKVN